MGPEAISLSVRSSGREGSYRFTCPRCDDAVEKRADRKIVALLVSAGVDLEPRGGGSEMGETLFDQEPTDTVDPLEHAIGRPRLHDRRRDRVPLPPRGRSLPPGVPGRLRGIVAPGRGALAAFLERRPVASLRGSLARRLARRRPRDHRRAPRDARVPRPPHHPPRTNGGPDAGRAPADRRRGGRRLGASRRQGSAPLRAGIPALEPPPAAGAPDRLAAGNIPKPMLNVGPLELLVVLAVALIVVGPERLPELARSVGKVIRQFRDVQSEVRDLVSSEMDDADVRRRGRRIPQGRRRCHDGRRT